MKRRWFSVVLMLWATIMPLLAIGLTAPAAQATGETYTQTSPTTITVSGGDVRDTATLTKQANGSFTGKATVCATGPRAGGCIQGNITISAFKQNGNTATGTVTSSWPTLISGTVTIAASGGATPGGGSDTASVDCDGGPVFGWAVCGLITLFANIADWIRDNILTTLLKITPLTIGSQLYQIWVKFRDVASVFLILVFFIVIIGTAIGLDSYSIKKTIPRLVVGAVLLPLSWFVCAIGVDIGNVLGLGMTSLMDPIIGTPQIDLTGASGFFASTLFIGGAALIASAGIAAISLGAIFTLVLGLLALAGTLIFRQIAVDVLVVTSPFWLSILDIVPNTQSFAKFGRKNMIRMIAVFPIVILISEGGRLFVVIIHATPGVPVIVATIGSLYGLGITLAAAPLGMSWAGGMMALTTKAVARGTGVVDKRFGKGSDWNKERVTARQRREAAIATDPTAGKFRKMVARNRSGTDGLLFGTKGSQLAQIHRQEMANKHIAEESQFDAQKRADAKNQLSTEDRIHAASKVAEDKLLEQRAAENGYQHVNVQGYEYEAEEVVMGEDGVTPLEDDKGNVITRKVKKTVDIEGNLNSVELSEGARAYLKEQAQAAIASGDQAKAIATMQSLGRSQGGRQVLSELQSELGGNDSQTVDPRNRELWDRSMKGVNTAGSPDLIRPKAAAFSGVSPQDFLKMDDNAKGRYLDWVDAGSDKAEAAFKAAEQERGAAIASGDQGRIQVAQAAFTAAASKRKNATDNLAEAANAIKLAAGSDRNRSNLSDNSIGKMKSFVKKHSTELAAAEEASSGMNASQYLASRGVSVPVAGGGDTGGGDQS